MDSRYYPGVEVDVPTLSAELRNLFDSEYEVQAFQVRPPAFSGAQVQHVTRSDGTLLSAHDQDHTRVRGTRVEIGMQKWFDKAAVAAVGVVAFRLYSRWRHSALTGNTNLRKTLGR
jgi:hypothetical protein